MADRFKGLRTAGFPGASRDETGLFGGMLTGHTSSTSDELERLRQRYEKLCDLMTRTAETDPDAAERVLGELQSVSEQLLILETTGPTDVPQPSSPDPDAEAMVSAAPTEAGPAPAAEAPLLAAPPPPTATPADPVPATPPADISSQSFRIDEPAVVAPPRIVAFRVTSNATPRPASRPSPAAPPATVSEPPPAGAPPSDAAATAAAPVGARPPAGADDPTRFSTAIRQWLERQRPTAGPRAAEPRPAPRPAKRGEPLPHGVASAIAAPMATPVAPPSEELGRIAAAVEQQAAQIERILEMCQTHQLALERLEARIAARLAAPPSVPLAEPGPELSELRGAVEEQRQRVTALAKTIHNLAQWLAAQRVRPER